MKFWVFKSDLVLIFTILLSLFQALVEQVTYTPFAMTSFYFGMTLLEMKTIDDAKKEVADKFLPTYRVIEKRR